MRPASPHEIVPITPTAVSAIMPGKLHSRQTPPMAAAGTRCWGSRRGTWPGRSPRRSNSATAASNTSPATSRWTHRRKQRRTPLAQDSPCHCHTVTTMDRRPPRTRRPARPDRRARRRGTPTRTPPCGRSARRLPPSRPPGRRSSVESVATGSTGSTPVPGDAATPPAAASTLSSPARDDAPPSVSRDPSITRRPLPLPRRPDCALLRLTPEAGHRPQQRPITGGFPADDVGPLQGVLEVQTGQDSPISPNDRELHRRRG